MTGEDRITGFLPVFAPDAKVLILGSMPSVESLRQSFYYAHPRNLFWPMMAEILSEPLPGDPQAKADMLLRHRIALWDSLRACRREGSLDSAIRDYECNDFDWLFRCCPGIDTLLFNGQTARRLYARGRRAEDGRRQTTLPSTSPAYTMPARRKQEIWARTLKEVLLDESL